MGIAIQRRRGTSLQTASFTGKIGEITIDTTKWVAVVHDGSTLGGWPLARFDHVHDIATDSTAGFMSAADKTKLDSVVGGVQNYQVIQTNGTDITPSRLKLNYTPNFAVTDGGGVSNNTLVDLSDVVSSGTYTKVTVSTKGRVTSGTILSASDIPSLSYTKTTDFATGVANVRLDQMTAPNADVSMNSHKIINVADPGSDPTAATPKSYVDAVATGLTFKAAVRVASTTNVNLVSPGTTIDTVSLNLNDRILLKDQNDPTANGIYIYAGSNSTLTRANDANTSAEMLSGTFVLVTEGHTNAGVGYVLSTPNPISLGSTSLTFVPFSSGGGTVTAGNGVAVVGNVVSVQSASSSRIAVSGAGVDLAAVIGLTPGTYQQFTVDQYGRIIGTTSNQWQPLNSGLTAITAISVNGFLSRTGSGAYASRTLQPGNGIAISYGDGAAGNPSISVTDNTSKQKVAILNNGSAIGTRSNINLIPGTGAALTFADNNGSDRVDVTIGLTPGGGAAPSTSQYVTLVTDDTLSNERVLAVGTGLTLTDGGSGNNVTIALVTDFGSVP